MRGRLPFFGILGPALILSEAISSTVPDISPKIHLTNLDDTVGNLYSHERWTSPPHKDATCHLIFQAASGLLQHWSNTAYPNGHSLAIGVIPVGTTLYHGTPTGVPPPTFDWVSFDPEHASMFAGGENAALLTFSPMRPLKVLYLDGNSAANSTTGALDTQYLIEYGEIRDDGDWNVFRRTKVLCLWAKRFGLDGFVKMEFDFEAVLCDFTDGIKHTSTTTVPTRCHGRCSDVAPTVFSEGSVPCCRVRPGDPRDLPIFQEPMVAASWYDVPPGLPFVIPDYSKFITLFDTTLAPGLVPIRHGIVERKKYRLFGISKQDAKRTMNRLEDVLLANEKGSGVRWDTILRNVKNRFKDRLNTLNRTLMVVPDSLYTPINITHVLEQIDEQLQVILASHFGLVKPPSSTPTSLIDESYSWARPVFQRCATALTAGLPSALMTREELVLRDAVQGAVSEICRVVVKSWASASAVLAGKPKFKQMATLHAIKTDVVGVMDWLGWSEWMRCYPACDNEHVCWMPEWIPNGWGGPQNVTTPICLKRDI